jgi:hypothetical protein
VRKGVDAVITDHVGRYARIRGPDDGEDDAVTDKPIPGPGTIADALARLEATGLHRSHDSGLPRKLRLYATAVAVQFAALLLTVLLWHRLTGTGKRKRRAQLSKA